MIETHFFEVKGMCHYKFYMRQLTDEMISKAEHFAAEYGGHTEVNQSECLYEINYALTGDRENCEENMAHIVSDLVQEQAILKVCEGFLRQQEGLSGVEKKEIGEAFLNNNYLSRQEGFSYVTYYLIYLPILKELQHSQGFNIDGWVGFRVSKYKRLLKDLLEQFTQDYLAKKEVATFIHLLREASFMAVPLEEEMHIVYSKQGKAMLYDKAGRNVTGHYIKKYCKDLVLEGNFTREDVLLHILMTLSPRQIYIHHKQWIQDWQLPNTLEMIFDESIIYCTFCQFCESIE